MPQDRKSDAFLVIETPGWEITDSFNVSSVVDTGERDSRNNEKITVNLISAISGKEISQEGQKLTGRIIEQGGSIEYVEFDHPLIVPNVRYGIFSFVGGQEVAQGTGVSETQVKASIANGTETHVSVLGDLP